MPLGLLGKKLGQTRVYDAKGVITPVTIVLAGPNRVLQCKTQQSDGYNAVQLGFGDQKEQRVTKPLLGHIKKFNGLPVKRILEFRNFSKEVKPGDVVGPALFAPGDYVDAIGLTKGRGFEGVVGPARVPRRRLDPRREGLASPLGRHRPAPVPGHGHARDEDARPHGPGAAHRPEPPGRPGAGGGERIIDQGRHSGLERRLCRHPRSPRSAPRAGCRTRNGQRTLRRAKARRRSRGPP